MMEYNVLDLFSGLGGFSSAFEDANKWAVTTVEINSELEPDIVADVMELRPSNFEQDFDVVLASPPCTRMGKMALTNGYFNQDAEPQTPKAADHLTLAYHTVGLIKGLNPKYWFVENPPGKMRDFFGTPTGTITQCQYGEDYQKRTHLWGEHPPMTYKSCVEGDNCHTSTPRSDERHPSDSLGRDSQEISKLPYELSENIMIACENGLENEVAEQVKLF